MYSFLKIRDVLSATKTVALIEGQFIQAERVQKITLQQCLKHHQLQIKTPRFPETVLPLAISVSDRRTFQKIELKNIHREYFLTKALRF